MHLCMTLIFILYCSCFKKANWYFCILLTFPMPCVGLYKWVTKRWVLSNCNRWKGCCHDICWQKDHQKYASFYRVQVGNIRLWELFQNHSSENRICLQFINLFFCQQYQVMFPTFLIFGNTLVLNKKYCLSWYFSNKKTVNGMNFIILFGQGVHICCSLMWYWKLPKVQHYNCIL